MSDALSSDDDQGSLPRSKAYASKFEANGLDGTSFTETWYLAWLKVCCCSIQPVKDIGASGVGSILLQFAKAPRSQCSHAGLSLKMC